MPSDPIIAQTMNANIDRMRELLKQDPLTSDELADLMGMDIGNVRALLHSQKDVIKLRVRTHDAWHWKGIES
jgi:DNA-directed RNA polymerase specialized sigma24 family protein